MMNNKHINKDKQDYESYLEYMYNYEKEYGYYPQHLNDDHWTPYSIHEYIEKRNLKIIKI